MSDHPSGIVTLTSDFGTRDSYVGAMRGSVLRSNPAARLVDITHEVPAQGVSRAAVVLEEACPCFPGGTVHLVVVDPGVGTDRVPLILASGGHWFVGPDNGVLLPAARALGTPGAWRIDPTRVPVSGGASATFHGRDLFGPVAGALSLGASPGTLGDPFSGELAVATPLPSPEAGPGTVAGEVLSVDHFGNLISNIPAGMLPAERPRVTVDGCPVDAFVRTYGDAPVGARIVALVGSNGCLEVACPQGSAAHELNVGSGARIEVYAT